jgi:putative MATE family efflux protein
LEKGQSIEAPNRADIRAKVLNLSGPALVELALATLVQMVDMIMVGRVGPEAVAAVGLTNQLVFFALSGFLALNVGTTALVARFIGAGDPKAANETARQGFILNLTLGFVVSIIGYMLSERFLVWMGAAPEVLERGGLLYARSIFFGMTFMTVSMGLIAVMRGAGDTRTPMTINIVANLVNVVGNYSLIYGKFGLPRLGVFGAGISTSISRAVTAILAVYVVYRGDKVIKLSIGDNYKFNMDIIKRIVNVGIPAALEQFIFRAGIISFVRIVAGLGTKVYAAHQISLNILSLSFMPGQAFGIAATTLVGQELGAERPHMAEECAAETRRLGILVSGIMAAGFFFLGPWIIRLYTPDEEIVALGALALKIIAVVQPAQSTQFILSGALRGAGDTRWPLYASVAGIWGVRVALGYLFVKVLGYGLIGAWVAMALDQCVRSVVIYGRFTSGKWKTTKV